MKISNVGAEQNIKAWNRLIAFFRGLQNEEHVHFLSTHYKKLKPTAAYSGDQNIRLYSISDELMKLYIGQYDLSLTETSNADLVARDYTNDQLARLAEKVAQLRRHPELEKLFKNVQEAVKNGTAWSDMDEPLRYAVWCLQGAVNAWDRRVSELERKLK